jgi:hypothetical protein
MRLRVRLRLILTRGQGHQGKMILRGSCCKLSLICTCEDLIKSMLLSREEGRNGSDSRTLCTLNHNLQPHQRIFVPRNLRLVLNPEGSIGHCVSASAFSLPLPLSLKAS